MSVESSPESSPRSTPMPPRPERGIVMLTFDDDYYANWCAVLPLFATYRARVTFFPVGRSMNDASGPLLRRLAEAGHAIGCHSNLHHFVPAYVTAHGEDAYLRDEIDPPCKRLSDFGLPPAPGFAYPSSTRTPETDAMLLTRFPRLRTGINPAPGLTLAEDDRFYVPAAQAGSTPLFYGKGIDHAGSPDRPDRTFEVLAATFDRVYERDEAIVLYAHNIGHDGVHHIMPAALERVLALGAERGVRFLSFGDI